MQIKGWIAGGLVLALTWGAAVQAAPTGKTVGGVTEYSYSGPKKKKKKVVKPEESAPALTRAEQSPPAPAAPAPAAEPPTYTQEHTPEPTSPGRTYSQTHSPGPNSGKAANGTWTPGGASILTTGPIYYPFPFQGGYGPITLAPIVGAGNGYRYDPYSGNNCAPPPTPECPSPPPPCAAPAPTPIGLPPLCPSRRNGDVQR